MIIIKVKCFLRAVFFSDTSLFPVFCRMSSLDVALILGNLEEISTFQQMLVQSLEECTK